MASTAAVGGHLTSNGQTGQVAEYPPGTVQLHFSGKPTYQELTAGEEALAHSAAQFPASTTSDREQPSSPADMNSGLARRLLKCRYYVQWLIRLSLAHVRCFRSLLLVTCPHLLLTKTFVPDLEQTGIGNAKLLITYCDLNLYRNPTNN
jgi:hypothetical protein